MSMSNTEKKVKDIRRNTRRKFSTEEKIRIVLDGLRGESSVAELCRREGINPNLYYRWSKDFLEAGRKRLSGDTVREANTDEVTGLKRENDDLKQAVAELYLRNDWHITDTHDYFVSESSVYRILKAHDLITSPQFTVMRASDKFQHPTGRVHELWQTDFTYFRVIGWGWYFLSTILDDYSRYIITWRLTTTMAAADVNRLGEYVQSWVHWHRSGLRGLIGQRNRFQRFWLYVINTLNITDKARPL